MRLRIIALLATLALAMLQPMQAAGEKADAPQGEGKPGNNVEMPFLIVPMSNDGKLIGYAYISSKMVATSSNAAIAIRDKLAFIQDAFVRDVNKSPVGKADDPKSVDTTLLNQRLVADAVAIVGENKVDRMFFLAIQFAPLHPTGSTEGLTSPATSAPATGGATAATTSGETKAPDSPQPPATSKPAEDSKH
jgi:hypothetical protein